MGPHRSLRGVGKTALGVAMVRARESLREDRLFDDPYAHAFVDAAPGVRVFELDLPEVHAFKTSVLLYLTADEAARLLTDAGDLSVPDSRLSLDHGANADATLLAQARRMPAMTQYTARWKGGLGTDAFGWLSQHGWQPRLHDGTELAASYGRPIPTPSSGGFITAVRRGSPAARTKRLRRR